MTALPGTIVSTWAEYRWLIEDSIINTPRNRQVRIGPSQLGTPCIRCLAHKLAGVPETREPAWLAWIGTAVHAQLAKVFEAFNAQLGVTRFLVEHKVNVGQIGGTDITGSLDLYDTCTAEITDWKIVGITTLRNAKSNGASDMYRTQQHLYARGLVAQGFPVDRVRIAYLPRNNPSLAGAYTWSEPYDEQVALDALARANALHTAITTVGLGTVLADLTTTPGCWSCSRYPLPDGTRPPAPGHRPNNDLRGLIIPEANTTTAA